MHKRSLELLRLITLVLSILSLSLVTAAHAAGPQFQEGPEQPPDRPPDVLYTSFTPVFGYAYTVEPGDDIWLIAVSHGLSMEELAATNSLEPPYLIHPGDRLWVPAEPAPVQRPTPPPPPTPAPAAAPAPAPLPPAPAEASPDAQLILNLMNQKRAAFGLAPLSWSATLAQAAQGHADDLAARGWGSHVGSDGATLRTRLGRAGYWASWASENWANARSAQQAFEMWWFEPDWGPHRLNILGSNYAEVGIGIAQGGWGYYFIADFGSR